MPKSIGKPAQPTKPTAPHPPATRPAPRVSYVDEAVEQVAKGGR